MITTAIRISVITALFLVISGCSSSDKDNDQPDTDLPAAQILITHPANNSSVAESVVTVRADIPVSAGVEKVKLIIDGIEIAEDGDGAPWEIAWPAYYWADGAPHTLLVKGTTESGTEIRNEQQFQVTVSTAAKNDLKFEDGLDGQTFQDISSLLVDFEDFPDATSYELVYSSNDTSETIPLEGSEGRIKGLQVGQYYLQYRALKELLGEMPLKGPLTDPIQIEILPPALPAINEPEVTSSESAYNIFLSWESIDVESTYTVFLYEPNSELPIEHSTEESSLTISGVDQGQYEWQLMRTNAFGHESETSARAPIDVGVFKQYYGGSGDDVAKQVIPSHDGGYIVLAKTKSSEISQTNDTHGEDWIFKVDEHGAILWQFVSAAPGRDRVQEIIELPNGEIIAVGNDWESEQAMALKLTSSGEPAWEIVYRPEDITQRYDFRHIVIANGAIYISSAEWGDGSCSDCTQVINYYLHTIDSVSGLVSEPTAIPNISGLKINHVAELAANRNGNLMISGYAYPENNDSGQFWGGAFLQVLDAELNQTAVWDNVGIEFQANVGDVIQLSNDNYLVIGQLPEAYEPAISLIASSGAFIKSYAGENGYEGYSNNSIAPGDSGDFYGLFDLQYRSSYSGYVAVMKFNAALEVEAQLPLLDISGSSGTAGILYNDDKSLTLLLTETRNYQSRNDVLLTKRVIEIPQ